ncbi:MAG: UDP-N-acetylmuramoyl-tripeptide--D-alanyl-D-alanine ligase, partial [Atopobiaceae bacterium]|nr:UDP-N-acetylmuramoyl-tripeptide--D-alanyl-D-alanine ligase [Atopobiaceae bacterium]
TTEPPEGLAEAASRTGCAVLRADGDDGEEFLLRLAAEWRRRNPGWVVVGVTGSVGKTTTKDLVACALSCRYRVHKTAGNYNNLIGMPLTLFAAPDDAEVLVVEMGMNHKGELSRLTRAALPDVALVTNVGTSHIGFLGSRENIARAKAEIVEGMGTRMDGVGPCLVLGSFDEFTPLIRDAYAAPAQIPCVSVGSNPSDEVRLVAAEVTPDGLPRMTVEFADGWSGEATLSIPGRHVAVDALFALAIADRLGVDRASALDAIAAMPAATMRLEVLSAPGRPRVIDDTYNSSPSSVAAALDVLCSMACEGRRVAVIGEIGELGDDARELHGLVGAYAAAKPLDMLVFVGGEMADVMSVAATTMGFSADRLVVLPDAEAALSTIGPVLEEDDLVLAKASRSVGLDVFSKGVSRS